MRIYNITQENSKKSLWFDIMLLVFITLVPLIACIFDLNLITFAVLFMVIIIDITYSINLYKKRKNYQETKSYHKIIYYADFEQDRLILCGKTPEGEEKFITYKYDEIEDINIELETFDSCTTRKHYTGIRDIAVYININEEETYVFHTYHMTFGGNLKTIYKIIDYCRGVKQYSYKLKGTGDQSEIKEKLDFYIENHRKLRVEKSGRKDLRILSLIIFAWGVAISIVAVLPISGIKGGIISCITFALIAYLIYFPVILDIKEEEENE